MTSIIELQEAIINLVKDDDISLDDINKLLDPAPVLINNPIITQQYNQVITILLKDRDGNSKFTINDIKLLRDDIVAITSLISGLLLIVGALPDINLQYDPQASEIFILKLLAYLFLIVIPEKASIKWSVDEKIAIVNVSMVIINTIRSSQSLEKLINKVKSWLKSKSWCKCMTDTEDQKIQQLDKNLSKALQPLQLSMVQIKKESELQNKLDDLLKEVKSLKSGNK